MSDETVGGIVSIGFFVLVCLFAYFYDRENL